MSVGDGREQAAGGPIQGCDQEFPMTDSYAVEIRIGLRRLTTTQHSVVNRPNFCTYVPELQPWMGFIEQLEI